MGLDISKIQALCFDVDGTLSDTDDLWVDRFSKILSPIHKLFPKSDLKHVSRSIVMGLESPGNVVYEALDRIHLDDDIARVFNFFAKKNIAKKPKQFWMIPGVLEMLAFLRHKFPMAVVSARDENTTGLFLNQFDIYPFFRSIVTSQSCLYTKPFPDPIRLAASQMSVSPENCLMIGDTTVDIRAGKSAGAMTLGVLCGFGTEKELRRAGADLILKSTAELLDIFN